MGTMAVPDATGHTATSWRTDDTASIASAAQLFDDLRARRLVPFARVGAGDFEQVRTFDAEVDEIMWVRPLQGG